MGLGGGAGGIHLCGAGDDVSDGFVYGERREQSRGSLLLHVGDVMGGAGFVECAVSIFSWEHILSFAEYGGVFGSHVWFDGIVCATVFNDGQSGFLLQSGIFIDVHTLGIRHVFMHSDVCWGCISRDDGWFHICVFILSICAHWSFNAVKHTVVSVLSLLLGALCTIIVPVTVLAGIFARIRASAPLVLVHGHFCNADDGHVLDLETGAAAG